MATALLTISLKIKKNVKTNLRCCFKVCSVFEAFSITSFLPQHVVSYSYSCSTRKVMKNNNLIIPVVKQTVFIYLYVLTIIIFYINCADQ